MARLLARVGTTHRLARLDQEVGGGWFSRRADAWSRSGIRTISDAQAACAQPIERVVLPLRHVLVSPEFHHWHHSSETAARDKNFAGLFSFYDVLFGSAYLPTGQHPKAFGVDHPMPSSYLALLAYPFVAWASKHKRDDPSGVQPHMSKGAEPAQPRQSAPLS